MFTFYQKTVIINKNYYTKSPGKDVRIGLYYKNRDRFEKEMNEKVDIRVHFGNLADLSVYVTGTAGGSERHRQ